MLVLYFISTKVCISNCVCNWLQKHLLSNVCIAESLLRKRIVSICQATVRYGQSTLCSWLKQTQTKQETPNEHITCQTLQ